MGKAWFDPKKGEFPKIEEGSYGVEKWIEYQQEVNQSTISFKEGSIRDLLWQPMDCSLNETSQLSIVNVYMLNYDKGIVFEENDG